MRFPEAARAADESAGPVWARTKRRGGIPLGAILTTLLILFSVMMIGLAVWKKSFEAAGAMVDDMIAPVTGMFGGEKAEEAAPAEAPAEPPAAPAEAPAAPAA